MVSTLGEFKVPKKLIPILHQKFNLKDEVDISYFGNRIKHLKHSEINGFQIFLVDSEKGLFILDSEHTYSRSRFCLLSKFNAAKGKLVVVGKIEKKNIGSRILPINAIYKIESCPYRPNRTEDWRRSVERQIKKDMGRICPGMFKNHLNFLQTVIAEYSQSEDFTTKGLWTIVELFKKEKEAYDYWMERGFEDFIGQLIYNIDDCNIDVSNEDVTDEQKNEYIRQLKAELRCELKGQLLSSFSYTGSYYRYRNSYGRQRDTSPILNVITPSGAAVVLNDYVDEEWFEERKIPDNRFFQSSKVTIFKDSKDFMLWKLQNQTE